LWLQGGPGCADGGQYSEIGPFNVYWNAEGNQEPTANGITWNDEYHLLFVDAPVGVGYSVCGGDLPITAMQYAVHMQSFLEGFFNVFTSLKGQPFYIFGESYAGHYIPAVTTILLQNYPQN
jgi:carboxypeptidase C (cathepsin A)